MTRCRLPVALLALMLTTLALVPSAVAQYRPPDPLPQPTPPPESQLTAPTDESEAPAAIEARPAQRLGWFWEPVFVLEGGWEENIGFTRPAGPEDVFGSLAVSIARVRRGPRSEFRLTASGAGYLYAETTTWNRADAFVSLNAQGPLSRRVDGRVNASYAFAHTDTENALIAGGLLLPLDRTKTAGAEAGLTWRAGERTSLSIDGTWFFTDFESDLYVDTHYGTGGLSLTRRVSRRSDVSLNGSVEVTYDNFSTRLNPILTMGYGHLFGSSLRVELQGGVSRQEARSSEGEVVVDQGVSFYGSARVSGRIRRATLYFRYRRGPQPTVGLGVTEETDSFLFGVSIPLGRRLELLGSGTYALRSQATALELAERRGWDAYLGMSAQLVRQLRLVAGYRFRRRVDPLGNLSNDRATVSLVYGDRYR